MSCWNKQFFCLFIVYYLVEIFRFFIQNSFHILIWICQYSHTVKPSPSSHEDLHLQRTGIYSANFFKQQVIFIWVSVVYIALCNSRSQSMDIYRNWDINVDTQNRKTISEIVIIMQLPGTYLHFIAIISTFSFDRGFQEKYVEQQRVWFENGLDWRFHVVKI
jgi:hypothetical protein